jgi:hypothetical protein
MGVSRNCVLERGRKIGITKRQSPEPVQLPELPESHLKNRPPMPAGARESWALICAGLSISGAAFLPPDPVLGRQKRG